MNIKEGHTFSFKFPLITSSVAIILLSASANAASIANGSIITFKGVQAGKCIGVKGSTNASGATLQSQGCSASTYQQWKAIKDSSGYYQLVNVGSGLCMDVPGASTQGAVVIQQWGCGNGDWQKWKFNDDNLGHFYVTSKASGLALDVLNRNTANGATIIQWDYWGGDNQQWIVTGEGSSGSGSGGTSTGSGRFPELTELKAFPTAEGYGRHAKGGRGGKVLHVTNLNDSGAGSLRAAIDATGPRTIVFDTSGVINLKSKLIISGGKGNGSVTIAGHTAPGKGIVVKGWTFGMIGGSDVNVRFIRTRVGTSSGNTMDGMGMASAENSIFDHCSISWTIDEAFSSRGAKNITLQRTLISEALNDAGHKKYPAGTQHGYAASIGGEVGSFHHNLLAHNAGRNWSLAGGLSKSPVVYAGRLDIRNNVVYNWRSRTTDGGAHEVNFVNNYYKPGPASQVLYALNAQNDGFPGTQKYYFSGNVMEGKWNESSQEKGRIATGQARTYSPWVSQPFFNSYVTTQTASKAYENVLANVGANVPMLDAHDKRVIAETKSGTVTYYGSRTGLPGLPDNEADVGGLENYPVVKRAANWDTDGDGMPNQWETATGLNPNDASDGNKKTFSKVGYTNLEMYLAELAGDFK